MRYRYLSAETVVARGKPLVVMPWLVALAGKAHEMNPYPWLLEVDGYGLVVGVAATRWVYGRPVEICYPVARPHSKAAVQTLDKSGQFVPVYAWAASPVEPPAELIHWSGWAVGDHLSVRVAGMPVSPVVAVEPVEAPVGIPGGVWSR
jgi:hypothetical protein